MKKLVVEAAAVSVAHAAWMLRKVNEVMLGHLNGKDFAASLMLQNFRDCASSGGRVCVVDPLGV